MQCLNEVRVKLLGYWSLFLLETEVFLLKFRDSHAFILEDFADWMVEVGIENRKKGVVCLFLRIVFLNMSQAHHILQRFILRKHLLLDLAASLMPAVILLLQFWSSLQKAIFFLHYFLHIGFLSPCILDLINFGMRVHMKQVKLRALVQQEFDRDLCDSS